MLDRGRVVFQAHDFLEPQPPWPDALRNCGVHDEKQNGVGEATLNASSEVAVYLLRVITHDWPDEFVIR